MNKLNLWFRNNSPALLIASGIVSCAGSIYLAIRATDKTHQARLDHKQFIAHIKEDIEENYISPEDGKIAISEERRKYAKILLKAYAPAGLLFTGGTAAIIGSYKIERGRELALATAYTGLKESFDAYRNKIKDKDGADKEKEVFDEVSKENAEKKSKCASYCGTFDYVFDNTNPYWTPDANDNLTTLFEIQKILSSRLKRHGVITLDEVLKSLGVDPSRLTARERVIARQFAWIYDPDDPTRPDYINFGLCDDLGNRTKEVNDAVWNGDTKLYLHFEPNCNLYNLADSKLFGEKQVAWSL